MNGFQQQLLLRTAYMRRVFSCPCILLFKWSRETLMISNYMVLEASPSTSVFRSDFNALFLLQNFIVPILMKRLTRFRGIFELLEEELFHAFRTKLTLNNSSYSIVLGAIAPEPW